MSWANKRRTAYDLMSLYDVLITDINETLCKIGSRCRIASLDSPIPYADFEILASIFENDGLKIDYSTIGKEENVYVYLYNFFKKHKDLKPKSKEECVKILKENKDELRFVYDQFKKKLYHYKDLLNVFSKEKKNAAL